jgi:hypothetical protein
MATLEARLRALGSGRRLVTITHKGAQRRALVETSPRGIVRMLFQPQPGDMYSSWSRIDGDEYSRGRSEGVIVWGARDPAIMEPFNAEPAAVLPLREE